MTDAGGLIEVADMIHILHGLAPNPLRNARAAAGTMTRDPKSPGFLVISIAVLTTAGLLSEPCREGWQRMAIGVAGSGIAAIALMAVAFLFRPLP
jgi:hypothetical protein